jgi:hypothetical protein
MITSLPDIINDTVMSFAGSPIGCSASLTPQAVLNPNNLTPAAAAATSSSAKSTDLTTTMSSCANISADPQRLIHLLLLLFRNIHLPPRLTVPYHKSDFIDLGHVNNVWNVHTAPPRKPFL